MKFAVVRGMSVQHANAMQTWDVIGPINIFAATMLGHALGRMMGDCFPTAVAVLHVDYQLLGDTHLSMTMDKKYFSRDFYPQRKRAASFINKDDYSDKNKHVLSGQPEAYMHLKLTLIFVFESEVPSDEKLKAALLKSRYAGGSIIDIDEISLHDSIYAKEDKRGALRAAGGGHYLTDRSELLTKDPSKGRLHSFYDLLFKTKSSQEGEPQAWLAPAVMGYASITDFQQRENVRQADGVTPPHAFVEPLLGIVELIGAKKLSDDPEIFWQAQWESGEVFLLKSRRLSELAPPNLQ